MKLLLSIKHGDTVLAQAEGTEETVLTYESEYANGDVITFSSDTFGFYTLSLDATLGRSLVYYKGGEFTFPVPFGEKKRCYSPNSFRGEIHLLSVRKAYPEQTEGKRNLSVNAQDCHENNCLYPHTYATVETRNESVFAAFNAVDGLVATQKEGFWPFTGWGVNKDPSAELTIDFGRPVEVSSVVIYNRACFPHDTFWKQGTIKDDKGRETVLHFVKTGDGQKTELKPFETTTLSFGKLINDDDDPKLFAALTQIEVWGREIKK